MLEKDELLEMGYFPCSSFQKQRDKSTVDHTLRFGDEVLLVFESVDDAVSRLQHEKRPYVEGHMNRFDIIDKSGKAFYNRKIACQRTGCIFEPGVDLESYTAHYTLEWQFKDDKGQLQRIYPGYFLRRTKFPNLRI